MITEINWILPSEFIPPFNKRILVLLGGQGSVDCMKTWTRYVTISDVIISRNSPNDGGENGFEYREFLKEPDPLKAYSNYQFDVHTWYEWKFCDAGGDCGDDADWYSDAICMWAPMPDFSPAIAAGEAAL